MRQADVERLVKILHLTILPKLCCTFSSTPRARQSVRVKLRTSRLGANDRGSVAQAPSRSAWSTAALRRELRIIAAIFEAPVMQCQSPQRLYLGDQCGDGQLKGDES